MHWNVAYWMLFLPKLIKTFPFAIKEYKNKNYTKHNSDTPQRKKKFSMKI